MAETKTGQSVSKIEKNLERLYKTALEQADNLEFLKGVNTYTNYALETPILKEVIDNQMAERADRYEKIDQAEKQAEKEMLASRDKLLAIIKDKAVDTSNFARHSTFAFEPYTDIVAELGAFERGEIIKSKYRSNSYEGYLFDIASNLLKMGYGKELSDMTVSQEKYRDYYQRINGTGGYFFAGNENGSFIFSRTWAERHQQEALLERERSLKKWGAVEKLIQLKCAYDAVMKNTSFWYITKDDSPYAHFFKDEDIVEESLMAEDLYHLMGQTRDDSPRKYRSNHLHPSPLDRLNVVAFKAFIQTLHNLLMQTVEAEQPEQNQKIDIPANDIVALPDSRKMPTNFKPRLVVKDKKGFLQIFNRTKPHEIAGVDTRQFKLIKCLFSAKGVIDEPYAPTSQSYERIFDAIKINRDKLNGDLENSNTMKKEVISIIEQTIDELQKKPIGKYLKFERPSDGFYRLAIIPKEGDFKTS